MEQKDYYIGLDIGTNSVGWAVVDEGYQLCRFKKYDMWGVRLFDSAETAAERRMNRVNRRRNRRKKQRIDLLQGLFAEEIAKIDRTFFVRLNESRLHPEDKSTAFRHPLFNDPNYTDVDYYKEYPTIYHLRKELMDSAEPHDIRLVYLALHHILKNRGHFLIEGGFEDSKKFEPTFRQLLEVLTEELGLKMDGADAALAETVLKDRGMKKTEKVKRLKNVFTLNTTDMDQESQKKQKAQIDAVCKFLAGSKGDFKKLVADEALNELKLDTFALGTSKAEDIGLEIEKSAPQYCVVFESVKSVFDWKIMTQILGDESTFSSAKVKEYEKHHENLIILRELIRKYCDKETYRHFFNNVKGGYSRYIGSLKKNGKKYYVAGCTQEEFYKELKGLLKSIDQRVDTEDRPVYQRVLAETEDETFLPLLRSKANSTIPRQIHQKELDDILQNTSVYLPFLNDVDEDGLSAAEKIRSIFTFRIPYYVGPLSLRHKDKGAHVWIKRKEEGYIYPWNYEKKIDREKSNEEFIRRLINQCTYLKDEKVLPKKSLLYSEFMVLNELNNLRIRGKRLSEEQVELKQRIYRDLFMTKTRVTKKTLLNYLRKEDSDLTEEDLSGFDNGFKASLSSCLELKNKVFGDRIEEDRVRKIAEDLIRWLTIYDDDKKMIKEVIRAEYPNEFTNEQLDVICRLKFSGWGNLSEAFLCGVEGADKDTGEVFTIIEALRNTNHNLMELLSGNYTFTEKIREHNAALSSEIKAKDYESLVRDLYVSPACKRGIWQTIRITEEIKKIMGHEPKKIFVEMTREHRDSGRTTSRKDQLLALYQKCEEDARDWVKEIEDREERDFSSIKLFLYYLQQGKCMYSGEAIDLDELMSKNSRWDRDHIYPQSKIKDDSLDNLVLVKKELNAVKDNGEIAPDIQKRMKGFWLSLLRQGFLSKKKFDRLTRTGPFTSEELAGFISRQLVETSQMSKAVAELLNQLYEDSRVVYVKAGLVSQFRQKDLGVLKSRSVNDYHHAKDAYLNVVVGDMFDRKFTSDPARWFKKNKKVNYSINQVFRRDYEENGKLIWKGIDRGEDGKPLFRDGLIHGGTIDLVRAIAKRNTNIRYTEYTYCGTGQLYNLTLLPKTDTAITIPLKKELPAAKYGGFKGAGTSYFSLIEFDDKKGHHHKQIVGVPIYVANMLEHNENAFIEYLETVCSFRNIKVLCEKIKKNALISVNGYPMRIRGENEILNMLKNNLQLVLSQEGEETLRHIEKYFNKKPGFEPDKEHDGIDRDAMTALYDEMTEKLRTVYEKRPANQGGLLKKNRELFLNLEKRSEMAKVLSETAKMFGTTAQTTADLSLIKGSKNAGNIAVNKNTLGAAKLILIHQSVTGLFETRVEL